MRKKICVFLSLCVVFGLVLSGCAKDADKKEKGMTESTQAESELTEKEPVADAITSLPVVTTERSIPEGSNVIEVDGKWIVAANINADYYADTSWRDMTFFVLSREAMNVEDIHIRTDVEEAGLEYQVYEDMQSEGTSFRERFSMREYFAYHGVDWGVYAEWDERRTDKILGKAVEENISKEKKEAYAQLDKWEEEFEWLSDDAIPQFHAYGIGFRFSNTTSEVTINSVTVSWPGVEVPVHIGEVRLHPYNIYDGLWENPGIERIWCGSNGSVGYMFGPELAYSPFTWKATDEISIKEIYCLDEDYEVVDVTVKGTGPGMDDIVSLEENQPVVISPGAEFEVKIFFTGPHLSELNVMGQGYFMVVYECGGVEYKALWEGGPQRLCDSMMACMLLFDNVDWQEYYERFYYTPEKDNGDTGNPELYDKIGWTQVWQERYGEK